MIVGSSGSFKDLMWLVIFIKSANVWNFLDWKCARFEFSNSNIYTELLNN